MSRANSASSADLFAGSAQLVLFEPTDNSLSTARSASGPSSRANASTPSQATIPSSTRSPPSRTTSAAASSRAARTVRCGCGVRATGSASKLLSCRPFRVSLFLAQSLCAEADELCNAVWCVSVLANGDIAAGASDGLVRVYTRNEERVASQEELAVRSAASQSCRSWLESWC